MKATNIFAFLAAFSLCVVAFRPCLAAEGDLIDVRPTQDAPVKLIFDTDIGGDIDDAFALGLIHSLCNRGVVELLAVTITNPDENAGRFVAACDAINGRPEIPVGLLKEGDFDSDFYPSATLAQKTDDGSLEYPVPEGYRPEDPVKLLRKTLANAQDGEIVIAQ
ncbi:MAG: nucleoside hydrolase, partial [Thermoguttaceae bacterium]|nr:nucleoside hydrolase [Thermoguttaceae bacterium]